MRLTIWTAPLCYNESMNKLADIVEMEVRLNYVSSSWVAWFYGVSLSHVYQAVASGRLRAVEVPAAKRNTILFDRRYLPNQWPSRRVKKNRRHNRLKEAA
jgi:hypothetical protein